MKPKRSHLDPKEQAAIIALADAWNAFLKLETLHPDETSDFRFAIHAAQTIVMARPVQRELNAIAGSKK